MSVLLDAIFAAASTVPDRIAIDDSPVQLSCRNLPGRVTAFADSLRATLGDDGRPVAIMLDNGIDWVIADLALLALGQACIPLPPFFTPEQIDAAVADAGAIAVIARSGILRRSPVPRDLPPAPRRSPTPPDRPADPRASACRTR